LPNSTTVIYHADCADGFGAAFVAWKHFGNGARYIPLHHGEDWETIGLSGQSVYILDYSFSRAILEKIARQARAVTQIDHHASARSPWLGLLQTQDGGLETFQHPELPLALVFNLEKSGVRLAWEYFFPHSSMPLSLQHVEDMDMWRFALPGTRPFSRALRLQPFDFTVWDQLIAETRTPESPRYLSMLTEGAAIEQFLRREIDNLEKSRLVMPAFLRGDAAVPMQSTGDGQALVLTGNQTSRPISGLAINASGLFASELGNLLAERSGTFGLIWQLSSDSEVKASLRAAGKVNVATIATFYGGGGHPNAAGFGMPAKRFFTEVLSLPAE